MTAIITEQSERRRRQDDDGDPSGCGHRHKGRRTLLIDLDPQANSTIAFLIWGSDDVDV